MTISLRPQNWTKSAKWSRSADEALCSKVSALVQHGGHYDVASTIQRLEESLNSQGESGIPPIEYSWGAATRLQHLCGDSVEALLSEADEAMYLCKKQRRKLRQSSVS